MSEQLIHRDLSWLQFNERVLAQANDPSNPLLERVKFLSISSSNLDEFFTIRFASLYRNISQLQKTHSNSAKIQSEKRILDQIIKEVQTMASRQSRILNQLRKELLPSGIQIITDDDYTDEIKILSEEVFKDLVFPELTLPTPFKIRDFVQLGNLQMAAVFPDQHWLPIPKNIPQVLWRSLETKNHQVAIFFLDDLVALHLAKSFNLKEQPSILRLTRFGDYNFEIEEEDSESIPDIVKTGIGKRDRGRPMRLQIKGTMPEKFVKNLSATLKLEANQIFPPAESLCLSGLWGITSQLPEPIISKPDLSYPPEKGTIPKRLTARASVFQTLREKDLLLHHPYDSFESFVNFIRIACKDPKVQSIEMTVYRTDAVSPIISALKSATSSKKVRVIIELRARFDELNNLRLAEELRKAGVEVSFGFGKLKVHAKVSLISRLEDGQLKHYTHLSTGNYNSTTARQYTDLAILTANAEIGKDAKHFFDSLWQGVLPLTFKKLVTAPTRLHRRIISHIESETKAALAGKPARIFAKANALVDPGIIENLYRASQAGVKIDLIIRGACSLIPGVPGKSDNIRVISIVDRYLEHSRMYYFENANVIYLSSADWMQRNFFSRLEIAFPVLDSRIQTYLKEFIIPTYLNDNVKASELTSKGIWKPKSPAPQKPPLRAQFYLQELAKLDYPDTPLSKKL